MWSPPSRWSGLKYAPGNQDGNRCLVSTLAVEWIEITGAAVGTNTIYGLHPRGGVD